ncbi:MAG: hypothetical protein V4603_02575, partial [Pseudomonadota bacterium]
MARKNPRISLLGSLFQSSRDPALEANPPARPHASLAAIALIFALGCTFTLVLYRHFVNLDQERIEERVLRGAQTLAASSIAVPQNPIVLDAVSVLERIQADMLATPTLSNEILAGYAWIPAPPALETVTLRYMARVTFNDDTQAYEMRNLRGDTEPFNVPIIDAEQTGAQPAAARDGEYYPVTLESGGTQLTNTAVGLNHYYDWSFRIAMDQARDSGRVTSR